MFIRWSRRVAVVSSLLAAIAPQQVAMSAQQEPVPPSSAEQVEKLSGLEREFRDTEAEKQSIRYQAGVEVMSILIRDSAKLNIATRLAENTSRFQYVMNPMSDETFAQALREIQGRSGQGNDQVLARLQSTPLMANPYVSAALSVGAFLSSSLRPPEKMNRLSNVVCAIDFSSRVAPDVRHVEDSLQQLDTKAGSFSQQMRSRFETYAGAVGYGGSWEQYQKEMRLGYDPLEPLVSAKFTALSARPDSRELGLIRFQIENVKLYMDSYSRLMKDVDDFFASYIRILQRNQAEQPAPVCESATLAGMRRVLHESIEKAKLLRADIQTEFADDVPAPTRRILYGIR